MTRLVAALFAVFAVALFVVPAEHAAAQTSPRDCAAENRVAHDSDNTKCGACTTGRWWNGTACTDARFDSTRATFQGHCSAAGGAYSEVFKQDVGDGSRVDVAEACFGIGGLSNNRCYLTTHPDFNPSAEFIDSEETYDDAAHGSLEDCGVKFLACVSPETQRISGNPLSGCVVPPRSVTVSASDNGKVSATWAGLAMAVAEGESGEAPPNVTLTFSAVPDSGFYVTVWTGACESSTNVGSGAADVSQTCEVEPGDSDVTVGAVFAEAICSGGKKPTAMSKTCVFPRTRRH